MNYIDNKIISLIDNLKAVGKAESDNDFCLQINLLRQNLLRIRQSKAHFTPQHIQNICKVYKVNANWIFGLSNVVFNRKQYNDFKPISVQKSVQSA